MLRHAGVCVPRQYASFAGIANGGDKCNAFFDKLIRRELGLIRFRGHFPKGGYDVHTDGRSDSQEPAPPPAVR